MDVAKEDSETLVEAIKFTLENLADLIDEANKDQVLKKLLLNIKSTMTGSASVNKASVEKFNSWRNEVLENWDELTDDVQLGINSFFCRMHHLLALSSAADSAMKNLVTKWEERFGKLEMTSLPEFQKWNTKESAMQRAIRTTCELLGPRGDQQSGCRSHWMARNLTFVALEATDLIVCSRMLRQLFTI